MEIAATGTAPRNTAPHARGRHLALAASLLVALAGLQQLSAEEAGNHGVLVTIPAVISSDIKTSLERALDRPLKDFESNRGKSGKKDPSFYLICDFNAEGKPNTASDFGACLTLSDYLQSLPSYVKIVAYVHGDVKRHAVLPVLACHDIIMSSDPKAHLGKVTDPGQQLGKVQQTAYLDTAVRRGRSVALVRKMFDETFDVAKKDGKYVDARLGGDPVLDLGRGDTTLYDFTLASKLGLCDDRPRNSLDQVLNLYELPRDSSVRLPEHPVAWRIPLSGTINGEMREKLQRRVKYALGQNANMLIFELSCGGGDAAVAKDMGMYIADLSTAGAPVVTIAFVTDKATNTAAFLALGCNKIVMQREQVQGKTVSQSHLGDFDKYLQEHNLDGFNVASGLAAVATKQHYPPVLAEGLARPSLRIYRVVDAAKGGRDYISEDTFRNDEKRWSERKIIKEGHEGNNNHCLTLDPADAKELGLAAGIVSNFDELCSAEGVTAKDVKSAESDWVDALADFLRHPVTSFILVTVGIMCLILELKMPGVVMPGVVSAICFVLFFWSQSQLNGQITWLALLLFLLGLVLIGLEVFVLPGFGVAGVTGVLLMLCGLGLVAYGQWPQTQEQWGQFGQRVGPFGLSILGAVVAAFLLARYLPSIPFVNRLILKPRDEAEEADETADAPVRSELASLLGAIGVAATPLRPAGKVQFGDSFVDVVAEGDYVVPGTRVQVIEIEGNRVVVKEV
jgi:membrane-bound ClpP family serine protease